MAKKIYVGNLSYETTEYDLVKLFEQVGQVESINIITDRDTGRSKGFAFVHLSNEDDVERAIVEVDGIKLHGQILAVTHGTGKGEND